MRIFFVADARSIHLQRIVRYFVEKGHEVHLLTRPGNHLAGVYDNRVHIHFLATKIPESARIPRVLRVLMWILSGPVWYLQLRVLLNRIRPDVLNCHYITINGYLGALSGFHPFIVTPWGSDVLIEAQKNSLYRVMARYALRKADLVMCDSQTMKAHLLDLGAIQAKIRPLALGVDTDAFNPNRRKDKVAQELRKLESPLVISTRNLRPIYNVELLIRAAPLILQSVPSTVFVISGDGEEGDRLKQRAVELGFGDRILWLGWIHHGDLPSYLAAADVYVSTSRSDSTSLSLQEAMACELPAVVTDIPANREWVTNGENGFIVPQDDPVTLAACVAGLLQSHELRSQFGTKSRQIIRSRAEEREEMRKLEELYVSTARGREDQGDKS